jgi:hypothetical protein
MTDMLHNKRRKSKGEKTPRLDPFVRFLLQEMMQEKWEGRERPSPGRQSQQQQTANLLFYE